MATEGTVVAERRGEPLKAECSGGLDTYADSDGGLLVRGVINVKGEVLEAVREIMNEVLDGEAVTVLYSGEVHTVKRRDRRVVNGLRLRLQEVNETGNVRVESDGPLES